MQTIFSIHNPDADNFSANYSLRTTFFMKKVTPPIKNNGPSLSTHQSFFFGGGGLNSTVE